MLTGPTGRGRRNCGGVAARGRGFNLRPLSTSGILLIGGASRRFGSAKALALFEDETLAARAWRLLGEACEERFAVGKAADALELPFPVLDDDSDVRAPVAGLVAGLRVAAYEVCVAVPVDMPLLTPVALRTLAAACRDAAVPPTGPLPGAYRKSALPVLERRLHAGDLTLRAALDELDIATIHLDGRLLVNVNTRADLAALSAARARGTSRSRGSSAAAPGSA